MDKIDKIKEIIKNNNGILLSRDLKKHGIHLQYLKKLENAGYINNISRGVYAKYDKNINEFYLLSLRYKKGIYSFNTALYFHNLTDRTPLQLDMTFPSNITIHDDSINVHYVLDKYYTIGLEIITLKDKTKIPIYNAERTICDIIKARNKIDPQILNTALREYVKSNNKDYILLLKYAKIFRIEKILRNYMEVL